MKKPQLKSTARAILNRNKQEDDRVKVSLYMSKRLYKQFKDVCDKEGAVASRVMEDLVQEFLNGL